MAVLVVTQPQPYEAVPGIFAGTAPRGTTGLVIYSGRRTVLARVTLRPPRRSFRVGPLRLPIGDQNVRVVAWSGHRRVASTTVGPIYGLPPASGLLHPAVATDRAAQAALARLRGDGVRAVWLRDLGTGRAASYNAGASFSAASTLKLAILMTALAHERGNPARSGLASAYRSLVLDSSNQAANRILTAIGGSIPGGSAMVNAFCAEVGCRDTDMFGGYLPDTVALARARDIPPVTTVHEPFIATYGKHTTAHDLGTLAVQLLAAARGQGLATRRGLSDHDARYALWLLLHARYPGLVRTNTCDATAHKAGWLGDVEHDTAIVFSSHGPLVAVIMSQGPVSLSSSQRYGAGVLRIARSRLHAPAAPCRR